MIHTIDGFHQDADGDWVAELSCLHDQRVRHEPVVPGHGSNGKVLVSEVDERLRRVPKLSR